MEDFDCNHIAKETLLPKEHKHYARQDCAKCGMFIRWVKDPAVTSEHDRRKKIIDDLLSGKSLNDREREFLENIAERRFLTQKQKDWYNKIAAKRLNHM